jgi:soluble lytic murein transglycosylase-like protein
MPGPSGVTQWLQLAQKWATELAPLRPEEILAIVWNESSGNPLAYNPGDPSWGLMGVSPLIASAFGGFAETDASWHTDPDKNMQCGARFLVHLKESWSAKFPDYLWVAAYNEGETQLQHGAKDLAYVQGFQQHLAALTSQ